MCADISDRVSGSFSFVAPEIVEDDDIASLESWTRLCWTHAVKAMPLIGPSRTKGATMLSRRRPARNVSVFQ